LSKLQLDKISNILTESSFNIVNKPLPPVRQNG